MEAVFNGTTTNTSILYPGYNSPMTRTTAPMMIDSMTWSNMPLRRGKKNTTASVEFWDDDVWTPYNCYDTALIMDAIAFGHRDVSIYVGGDYDSTLARYNISLDSSNPMQYNPDTGRFRPIRLPAVPKLTMPLQDDGVIIPDMQGMPNEFYCPITSSPMSFPVVASDGHSYDFNAISRWLTTKLTSPVTGATLETPMLVPNHSLRKVIRDYACVSDGVAGTGEKKRKAMKMPTTKKKVRPTFNAQFGKGDSLE